MMAVLFGVWFIWQLAWRCRLSARAKAFCCVCRPELSLMRWLTHLDWFAASAAA